MLSLRIRTPDGVRHQIQFSPDITVHDFQLQLSELGQIDIKDQKILYGYPLKHLDCSALHDMTLKGTNIESGETIILDFNDMADDEEDEQQLAFDLNGSNDNYREGAHDDDFSDDLSVDDDAFLEELELEMGAEKLLATAKEDAKARRAEARRLREGRNTDTIINGNDNDTNQDNNKDDKNKTGMQYDHKQGAVVAAAEFDAAEGIRLGSGIPGTSTYYTPQMSANLVKREKDKEQSLQKDSLEHKTKQNFDDDNSRFLNLQESNNNDADADTSASSSSPSSSSSSSSSSAVKSEEHPVVVGSYKPNKPAQGGKGWWCNCR